MKSYDNKKLFQDAEEERKELTRLLQRGLSGYPAVAFAYLYGSFLEERPYEDIDIGIYLAPGAEEKARDLTFDLAAALSRKTGRPVDVRPLNTAPTGFLYHVFRGRLILDKDEDLRVQIMEKVIMHYLDMKPLMERSLREAMTRS